MPQIIHLVLVITINKPSSQATSGLQIRPVNLSILLRLKNNNIIKYRPPTAFSGKKSRKGRIFFQK